MRQSTLSSDDAVTEVVGQILIFGILSVVLTLSLVSFNVAKDSAEERIVSTTASAVAQQVADLVVDTAIMATAFEDADISVRAAVNMPEFIESRPYTVELNNDDITVVVSGRTATAPLFAADSGATLHICDQDPVIGGPMQLWVVNEAFYIEAIDGDSIDDDDNIQCDVDLATASGGAHDFYLFLYP